MSNKQELIEQICDLKDELERSIECMERLLILLRDNKPTEKVHREFCKLIERTEKKSRDENFWANVGYARTYGKRVE